MLILIYRVVNILLFELALGQRKAKQLNESVFLTPIKTIY